MALNDFIINFGRSFLFALATLLPILNPPAVAPIFLTLTEGAGTQVRTQLAKRVAVNILIMLAIAMFAGNVVLDFFGISLPIVRIGGGLLVIATAWRLVSASDYDAEHAQNMAEAYSLEQVRSKAFYPLTFPMICGPGALSAALTVGATLHDERAWATTVKLAGSLPAIAVAALVVYLCLRFAAQFMHKLGPNGTAVLMRLSAFILLCLGVQIVWDGVHELLLGLIREAAI
ncbi:MarC family protein [Pollutimonas sp. M17]|uniref:MarC family protein n=1 Tax=Pollutimonas sp. M17 TaxID=2962065 RepID=UPI0021F47933|nr:MarC family protein [Pollutimonas sp. M17]UYO95350.1 NAAT family transporter [Pollutimonas sp. M17]HWK70398.1 MarC family protein [Burkholderiaceae bacterium]